MPVARRAFEVLIQRVMGRSTGKNRRGGLRLKVADFTRNPDAKESPPATSGQSQPFAAIEFFAAREEWENIPDAQSAKFANKTSNSRTKATTP